jgi:hypothetical protein
MHHVEEEEKKHAAPPVVVAEKTAVVATSDKTREEASQASAADRLRDEYLAGQKTAVQEPTAPLHPGYAPQSRFAPPPPDSPAYDSAYNRPEAEFTGLDIGLIKVGVKGHSLDFGANVGLASAEFQLGQETRIDGEFMPMGGPVHARTGAGFGFDGNGLHSEVGAGANFFDLVRGDADFGVNAGKHTGVSGDVSGKVWPVHAQGEAGADISPDGADAYTGGNTGIGDVFDVRAGGHVNADHNSGAGAGVGVQLGDRTLDFGPSISTDGNSTVRPGLHLDPGHEGTQTFYPTGDRVVDSEVPAKS